MSVALFYVASAYAQTPADSTMRLKGGEKGTVLKSLTIEGEDRVRIKIGRPELKIDLDPATAPGLEWESIWTVLDRGHFDLIPPLLGRSAFERSPYRPRPWLRQFRESGVARFRPALKGVERWALVVANSRGETVRVFDGKSSPPKEIVWDGRSADGDPVAPGLTYSYVLEAYDKAGNKRNFVGEGFELPSYLIETNDQLAMMFDGGALTRDRGDKDPAILLEVATRINQFGDATKPVQIQVTARSYDKAQAVTNEIARAISSLLLGDPARIQQKAEVHSEAPANATVLITVAR
jgi:hypothetical protein